MTLVVMVRPIYATPIIRNKISFYPSLFLPIIYESTAKLNNVEMRHPQTTKIISVSFRNSFKPSKFRTNKFS